MQPAATWRPQKTLGALAGLVAGLYVVGTDLGTETSLADTLGRAGVAAATAGVAGYVCGAALRWLMRDVPEPELQSFFEVPRDLVSLRAEEVDKVAGEEEGRPS